jgi:hypothetical protein
VAVGVEHTVTVELPDAAAEALKLPVLLGQGLADSEPELLEEELGCMEEDAVRELNSELELMLEWEALGEELALLLLLCEAESDSLPLEDLLAL